MLKSKELRARAWNSLKGKYWLAFAAVIVAGLLMSIGTSFTTLSQEIMNIVNGVDPSEMDNTAQIGALVLSGSALVIAIIGAVITFFVGNPTQVGLCNYFIKNTDSKPAFKEVFAGFKVKYGRNVGALILAAIKLILWTCVFIIPGIIKSFEYAMLPYVLADNPELSSKEAFKKTNELMKGNKWRLFKLDFSFIGWYILCGLTLGLGTFFLIPYVEAAMAEFYVEIKNK